MANPVPPLLELQNRATMVRSENRTALWIAAGLMLLILAAGVAVAFFMAPESGKSMTWGDIVARMRSKFQGDWFGLLLVTLGFVASLLHICYMALSRGRERLVLNESGMSYISPLPGVLQFLYPGWTLPWSQLRRAEFKTSSFANQPGFVTLVLHGALQQRTIRPYMWVDPTDYRPPSLKRLFGWKRPTTLEVVREVMESPVVRFIQGLAHVKLIPLDLDKTQRFALERSPAALTSVGVFLVSTIYALADTLIVNAETYVSAPPYAVYVTGGLAMGLLSGWFMRATRVPVTETVVVAILTGAAFGAALYPGLLRLNQMTDTEGLQICKYQMREPGYFVPQRDGLPEIRFPVRHREFWSHYASGLMQDFELRKGGLGFYQINMQPVYDRIEQFYTRRSS